jgi:hypothetical protein
MRGRLERGVLFAPEVRGVAVRVTRSNGQPQDAVLTGEARAFRDAQLSEAYNLATTTTTAAETGDAKRRSTSTTAATAPPRVYWTLEVEWSEPKAAERKSKPRLMLKNVPAHDVATALGRANPLPSTLVPPPMLVAHASTGEAKNRHNAELSRRLLPSLQTSFAEAWIGLAAPRRRVAAPAAVIAIAASLPPRAVALPPPRSRVTSPRVVAPRSRVSPTSPTSSELDPTQLPNVLLRIMGGYVATTDYVDAAANPKVRALGAKLRAVDRVACGNDVCDALLRSGATLEQLRRKRGDLDDDDDDGGEKEKRLSPPTAKAGPRSEEEGGGGDDEGKEENREATTFGSTMAACAPRCTDRIEALVERIHEILRWNRHLSFVWTHVRYELPEAAAGIFGVAHLGIFHSVFSNFGHYGSIEDAEFVVMCPPKSPMGRALAGVISELRLREGVINSETRDEIHVVWETDNCTREGLLEEGAAVWLAVLYYLTSLGGAVEDGPGRIAWIESPKEVLPDARLFGKTLATIIGADPAAPFDVRVGAAPFPDTNAGDEDDEDEDVFKGDEEDDNDV